MSILAAAGLVVGYILLWIIAAVALYPFAVRDGMEGPEFAAACFAVAWPVLILMGLVGLPFWLLGRFVLLVHRGWTS